MTEAILIVDPQNDFFPGGALGVPDGDEIVLPIQKLLNKKRVEHGGKYLVFVSQDWHPEQTKHFKEGGGIWPPHCVQDTDGSEIHKDIEQALLGFQIHSDRLWVRAYKKGTDPEDDGGYSAFDAVAEGDFIDGRWTEDAGKPLLEDLNDDKIDTLIVCGLATDYCVKASVLDALKNGFKVKLLKDGIRAVNINEGDGDKALQEMVDAGAEVISIKDV